MSNHITEQEAREASDRLKIADDNLWDSLGEDDEQAIENEIDACETLLIRFARQELNRRDAERAERDIPITAEWCLANGATEYEAGFELVYGWDLEWCEFNWRPERGCRMYVGDYHFHVNIQYQTRGQLLDLLAALKGGAS